MHYLFEKKKQYIVNDSIDKVRTDIKLAIEGESHNYSANITGRFVDLNVFVATTRWSLVVIRWVETSLVYVTGNIASDGDRTLVDISIRPNSIIVISFYGTMLGFVVNLVASLFYDAGIPDLPIVFLPCFSLVLALIMLWSTARMKTRLERLIGLS